MRKRLRLAAFGAAAMAAPAYATDWYVSAAGANGLSITFVDKDSIRVTGDQVRQAQVYLVLARSEPDGTAALDSLMEFDCRGNRRRFLSLVGFDERMVPGQREEGTRQWQSIVAGSQDASTRDFICSGDENPSGGRSFGSEYPFAAARAAMAADAGK